MCKHKVKQLVTYSLKKSLTTYEIFKVINSYQTDKKKYKKNIFSCLEIKLSSKKNYF